MLLIEIFEKLVEKENEHFDIIGLGEKLEIVSTDVFHPVAIIKDTYDNIVKYGLYTLDNCRKDLVFIRNFKSLDNAVNALHALSITEK